MSSTVWKEQIDTALISYISSTIGNVRDETGAFTIPITVLPDFPEREFVEENTLPAVTFFIAISRPDYIKKSSVCYQDSYGEKDLVNKTVEVLAPTKPFILQYQIDFWAEYQTHLVDMTLKWDGCVEPRFLLPVKNADGESLLIPVLLQATYAFGTIAKKNQRLFRKSYFYNIAAETDELPIVEAPLVTERDFTFNGTKFVLDK